MADTASEFAVGALHVRDLDESLGFYRDQLGLEQVGEPTVIDDEGVGRLVGHPGGKLTMTVLNLPGTSANLELVQFQTPAGEPVDTEHANPGTVHFGFYVDDMDAAWGRLREQGVESVSGPEPIDLTAGPVSGGKAIFIKDPDGIRVELLEAETNLDASPRDPARSTGAGLVTELSHFGLAVESLDRSIAFYRDLLGFEVVLEWLGQEDFLRQIVGYPEADINIGMLRLPGTAAYLELLEFRRVPRTPIDPAMANPGGGHITMFVDELAPALEEIRRRDLKLLSDDFIDIPNGPLAGGKAICCTDPEGVIVQLIESENGFDGKPRRKG